MLEELHERGVVLGDLQVVLGRPLGELAVVRDPLAPPAVPNEGLGLGEELPGLVGVVEGGPEGTQALVVVVLDVLGQSGQVCGLLRLRLRFLLACESRGYPGPRKIRKMLGGREVA
jgi:hypothetical protein